VPVEALVKCKMQDNLEFLQWSKRYWDKYFPGGDYDALARRKEAGASGPVASAPRAPTGGAARRPTGGAAPRTRTPQSGTASAALAQENNALKETVNGLERERDFYFSKLRDIELLIQQEMEAHPELENDEGGILKQIQTILYSTEVCFLLLRHSTITAILTYLHQEGFEIPAEAEGEVEEETF
jgi:RP/EB family microtubule-associated protein